ncbi:MAG: RNA polymerase sigma factor [Gemmatimonadaceae bacterium]|nr:RNA polymerase sigma factor [Gemmatimonadaceae bacterium]
MIVDDTVERLVAEARAGDRAALDRLLSVARPQLMRYARRHCEADDVEEAVQDSLWILYRRLGGLRRATAFMAWLFQVVRRACLRYARRSARRSARRVGWGTASEAPAPRPLSRERTRARGHSGHVSLDDVTTPEDDPMLRIAIGDAIAALPPHYREVLLLKDVQGLSASEVADALDLSIENTKSRLHRARVLIRTALADDPAS